jgi:chromosome segregation ATPase
MNRRELSREINALTAQIAEKQKELDSLVDDLTRKKVDQLVDLVAEREKLRGEHTHLTRTMQQRGLLL